MIFLTRAAPHDTLLDKAGNVWFSDFQHQFISKLDPKTGKVTRYPVPISKPGFPTGGLMITMDKDGNIWEGMMGQAQIAMLDPKTEKVSIYLAPDWDKGDTRFTMIDALHSHVDGKLWTKTNGGPDPNHPNKLYQFDLATKTFNEVLPPPGKRDIAAYGLITDLDNNVYGLDNNPAQRQIWRTNAKTGETTYIDLPTGMGGARRGHIDSQNRLWFSQFHANRYARYDAKTRNITVWDVPVPYAGAYDVQFDDVKYAWGADMSTDLVQRLNVETGEWDSISCPRPSIRAISTCRRIRTASPACGPKASRPARSSISSRLRRNEPFRYVAVNCAQGASKRSLLVRAAIERGIRRIDGAPAARADLALDNNATPGKFEIRTRAADFVPLRAVLIPSGGLRQFLLRLRLVFLGFGGSGTATGRGGGDNAHCFDKSPPR